MRRVSSGNCSQNCELGVGGELAGYMALVGMKLVVDLMYRAVSVRLSHLSPQVEGCRASFSDQ